MSDTTPKSPPRKELRQEPGFERLTYFDADTGLITSSSINGAGMSLRFPEVSPSTLLAALYGLVDQIQDTPDCCRELADVLAHLDQAGRYLQMRSERISAEIAHRQEAAAASGSDS